MKQRRRIYYSAAQRSEIWDRWPAGERVPFCLLCDLANGRHPPFADRCRAKQALSLSKREEDI